MQQCSHGMLSVIAKGIIRQKCFHSIGLNRFISFKFHTAQPALMRGIVEKRHPAGTKSIGGVEKQEGPEDFFGIESDEGVIHVKEKTKSFREKSSDSNDEASLKKERVLRTSFGHLRLDSDNQPKIHGQFESNIAESEFSYGSDMEKQSIQDVMRRKERPVPIEKFYVASVNKKGPSDSNQYTIEEVVTGSADSDTGHDGNVREKLDLGFIDRTYFCDETNAVRSSSCDLHEEELCVDSDMLESNIPGEQGSTEFSQKNCTDQLKSGSSFIDSIYFEDVYNVSGRSHDHSHQAESTPLVSVQNKTDDYESTSPELKIKQNVSRKLNFIDSVYFGTVTENIHDVNGDLGVYSTRETSDDPDILADSKSETLGKDMRVESSSSLELNQGTREHLFPIVGQNHTADVLEKETILSQGSLEQNKVLKELENELHKAEQASANEDEVHTAYKYVLQLRKAEVKPGSRKGGKFDSKGFRILKGLIPDLSQLTRSELISFLKERVLFSNDDIVILNKPYNFVVHESKTTKLPTLSSVLDDLARELDTVAENPQLYSVHRLDKETTGCFLLARSELAAQKLKALFAQRRIEKKYLVVTTRVPDPYEALNDGNHGSPKALSFIKFFYERVKNSIIDIPIAEGKIANKMRMVLQPDLPKELKYKSHVKNGKRAITHYKVSATSENAALLEVWPETGIKHQIRVHLGFGINCPVLGDHKYSHLTKLAPQRLSGDILRKLKVQQSKVRYVPMHIHSRTVMIPEYLEGRRDLFVSAPLPEHIKDTLKCLKFKDI